MGRGLKPGDGRNVAEVQAVQADCCKVRQHRDAFVALVLDGLIGLEWRGKVERSEPMLHFVVCSVTLPRLVSRKIRGIQQYGDQLTRGGGGGSVLKVSVRVTQPPMYSIFFPRSGELPSILCFMLTLVHSPCY